MSIKMPPKTPIEVATIYPETALLQSRLKDDFAARDVMVKGPVKVEMHLKFGVITLFADQLIRLLT